MPMPGMRTYGVGIDSTGMAAPAAQAAAPAANAGISYSFNADATITGAVLIFAILFFGTVAGWHAMSLPR